MTLWSFKTSLLFLKLTEVIIFSYVFKSNRKLSKIFQALEILLDILRTNLTSNWGGYIIPTNENKDQVCTHACWCVCVCLWCVCVCVCVCVCLF